MACTTCIRWMVWNESDQNQIFYWYDCTNLQLDSHLIGPGQFFSVCGCQESGAYASSNDVYFENGGSGYINYNGLLLYPCLGDPPPEPSVTLTPFPTRTPNHTPSNTPTNTVTPTVTRTPNITPTPTSIICGSGVTTTKNVFIPIVVVILLTQHLLLVPQ